MGKKKKKKKHDKQRREFSMLSEIDRSLLSQYGDMIDDIETYQYQIYLADKKQKKKNKKKKYKNVNGFYNVDKSLKARKKVVKDMEKKDYIDHFVEILRDVGPVVTIIARLIAALILAILSFDSIKRVIKPETLEKMDRVFSMAMSV